MEAAPQGSIPLDQKRRNQFESAAFRKFQRAKKEGGDSPPELLPSGEFIGEKCHGHQKLTNVEELILVGQLLSSHNNGMEVTRKRIRNLAGSCYPSRAPFGDRWVTAYLRRQDAYLAVTRPKRMSSGRKSKVTYTQTKLFVEVFSSILSELQKEGKPVLPETLVNADETLIRAGANGKLEFQVVPKRQRTGQEREDNQVKGSLLAFVTASGDVPVVLVCTKDENASAKTGKKRHSNSAQVINIQPTSATRKGDRPRVAFVHHMTSSTGYMNSTHTKKALEFFGLWAAKYTDASVLLLWDNLAQHRSNKVLTQCQSLGVVCQMLPPNSSHFLQPLDNVVFATLKNQAGTIYNDTKAAFDAMQLRYPRLLERAAAAAFDVAFKPSLIKAAWKNVGIWPFSPEIIEARALKQTGGGPVNKFTGKEKGAKKSNGGKGEWVGIESVEQKTVEVSCKNSNENFRKVREIVSDDSLFLSVEQKPTAKNRKKRCNTATKLFTETGGRHSDLLRLQKELREKKEAEDRAKAEKKVKKQEGKRKREENGEEKRVEREAKKKKQSDELQEKRREREERERVKQERKQEKMEEEERNRCKAEGCRWLYNPEKNRATQWWQCACGDFKLCPIHTSLEALRNSHQETHN